MKNQKMKIAVIGAGNGGQSISAYLSMQGYEVVLYDRNPNLIDALQRRGGITLQGAINGSVGIARFECDLAAAIQEAEVIMVTTTANAHGVLAEQMAPSLKEGQIVVLNPGRTGGALEFRAALTRNGFSKRIYLAEAQTLVYACRMVVPGQVHIIGVKDKVLLSALPSSDTEYVLRVINRFYPCFTPAENVLVTSFENIGAIFHPSIMLFNAATIERGDSFYFYRDMTPNIAEFIEALDCERLHMGKAYGIDVMSATDWVAFAYTGVKGDTLCERMKNNPAYFDIKAPAHIYCRQVAEDIPMGFVPMLEFGRIAGVRMPLFESILPICSQLLGIDFRKEGRSLEKMGLSHCRSVENVLKTITR